jgi:D-galactose 1-dehydrogenase
MGKMRIGLVGVGKIACDQHLPVLSKSPDFELVGIASRHASVPGVPNHKTLREMLNAQPEIEAIALCTPPGPREADARLALEAGLHVLLEKPPAASVGAARELASLAVDSVVQMSWHSRHAPAVEPATQWLAKRKLVGAAIEWREDIRVWHPGQDWILEAGGLGVFDPGINALSILTALVTKPIVVEAARLGVPEGRQAPLTADLALRVGNGVPVAASFDFLQTGQQIWTIRLDTEEGTISLLDGGARMSIDGSEQDLRRGRHFEYEGVYREFARAIRAGESDCDLRPIEIVADAFLLGRAERLGEFSF